jgi:hypothetical protein
MGMEDRDEKMKHMRRFFIGALFLLISVSIPSFADEVNVGTAIFLNTLPGLGLGSYIQGDPLGGTILLVADIGSMGCVTLGGIVAFGAITWWVLTLGQTDIDPALDFCAGLFTIGLWTLAIGFPLSKVFGIIRPLWFAAEQKGKENGTREEGLHFDAGIYRFGLQGDTAVCVGVDLSL